MRSHIDWRARWRRRIWRYAVPLHADLFGNPAKMRSEVIEWLAANTLSHRLIWTDFERSENGWSASLQIHFLRKRDAALFKLRWL